MSGYPVVYGNSYNTPNDAANPLAKLLPGISFYIPMLRTVYRSAIMAKRGQFSNEDWVQASLEIIRALERVGVSLHFENLKTFMDIDTPCVFVGNHMSTLETFVLPAIIQPHRPITFVVKQGLAEYPFFKHVILSRNSITVGRNNPREDLKAVLEGGVERIQQGTSIVIFPQATRSYELDPKLFNTIGVKLAKKAGVPVVPLALKTDAWGIGKRLKDFGKISPEKSVHFRFGKPMEITGNGKLEHQAICEFITNSLSEWRNAAK